MGLLGPEAPPAELTLTERISAMADSYLYNLEMAKVTGANVGVHALFLWQPMPPNELRTALTELVEATSTESSFQSLSEMFQEQAHSLTYVDKAHYGENSSRQLAKAIAEILARDGYLVKYLSQPVDHSSLKVRTRRRMRQRSLRQRIHDHRASLRAARRWLPPDRMSSSFEEPPVR